MKFQILAFFFLLLCAQVLSTLALESKEEKGAFNFNENVYSKEDGAKRDELVFSKASRGKGTNGSQNDNDRSKKSKAVTMLIKPPAYISNIGIGAIVICLTLVFDF